MSSMSPDFLVICGLHRSGTTYVGRLLSESRRFPVIHEPMNIHYGIKNVPIVYPYVETIDDKYSEVFNNAANLKCSWNKDAESIENSDLKRLIYRATGGRSGLRWDVLRLRKILHMQPEKICWKDPFASLATPYLIRHLNASVICMVRHPAAIHYSTNKQGWRFDIQNLMRQPDLISRYGNDIPDLHWELAKNHAAASIALLWKFMVRINTPLAQKEKKLLIVTHEQFCIKPIEMAKLICDHASIEFTPKMEKFVSIHSAGEKAESKNGDIHDFRRNSKALVDIWRGHLSSREEEMMKDIVGNEVIQQYGKW